MRSQPDIDTAEPPEAPALQPAVEPAEQLAGQLRHGVGDEGVGVALLVVGVRGAHLGALGEGGALEPERADDEVQFAVFVDVERNVGKVFVVVGIGSWQEIGRAHV